jgi:hypothetical protein
VQEAQARGGAGLARATLAGIARRITTAMRQNRKKIPDAQSTGKRSRRSLSDGGCLHSGNDRTATTTNNATTNATTNNTTCTANTNTTTTTNNNNNNNTNNKTTRGINMRNSQRVLA